MSYVVQLVCQCLHIFTHAYLHIDTLSLLAYVCTYCYLASYNFSQIFSDFQSTVLVIILVKFSVKCFYARVIFSILHFVSYCSCQQINFYLPSSVIWQSLLYLKRQW